MLPNKLLKKLLKSICLLFSKSTSDVIFYFLQEKVRIWTKIVIKSTVFSTRYFASILNIRSTFICLFLYNCYCSYASVVSDIMLKFVCESLKSVKKMFVFILFFLHVSSSYAFVIFMVKTFSKLFN